MKYTYNSETLYHHGIPGQKWGLRRFQNEDGSLTAAGREHYGYGPKRQKYEAQKMIYKSAKKDARNAHLDAYAYNNRHPISKQTNKNVAKKLKQKLINAAMYERASKDAKEAMKAAKQEYKNSDEYKARQEKIKKAAIAGAAVAATALAAYGVYKVGKLKVERANTILEGRKLCAKTLADSNRELYSQVSGYYQGKGYSDPKHAPVNRLSDAYTKTLRKDMARYQKNITEASKAYNDADKILRSSNLNKLKAARKYVKESGSDYNSLLERANDYIDRDRSSRALWTSDGNEASFFTDIKKRTRRSANRR